VSEDFSDLLRALRDAGVRFLVVGAHALAAHGVPRVTGDLDIWLDPTEQNAHRATLALARFGAPLDTLGIGPADFTRSDQVVQLGLPPFRVDLLTSISGVTFDDAWADRLGGTLFAVDVDFLGKASFIRNKLACGRPKDLQDLRSLGV
jgi:hypothetical protein